MSRHQINLVFLSGDYEESQMSTYPDEVCDLVRSVVHNLRPALGMFNHGLLVGEEVVYKNHTFNVILKRAAGAESGP